MYHDAQQMQPDASDSLPARFHSSGIRERVEARSSGGEMEILAAWTVSSSHCSTAQELLLRAHTGVGGDGSLGELAVTGRRERNHWAGCIGSSVCASVSSPTKRARRQQLPETMLTWQCKRTPGDSTLGLGTVSTHVYGSVTMTAVTAALDSRAHPRTRPRGAWQSRSGMDPARPHQEDACIMPTQCKHPETGESCAHQGSWVSGALVAGQGGSSLPACSAASSPTGSQLTTLVHPLALLTGAAYQDHGDIAHGQAWVQLGTQLSRGSQGAGGQTAPAMGVPPLS